MQNQLQITTIDANYTAHNIAALYMLSKNGHAAFIDTGTQNSFEEVMLHMQNNNITANNVDYVILTHIHLDHAGGASHMMQQFPNAKLVVHPFGSRHMADPSKLIAGTKAVYGEQKFLDLYGHLTPISVDRIIESVDEMQLMFQDEVLTLIDTPGHAKHHHCIYYENGDACFTGDTLGLSYPDLNPKTGEFCLLPTTTPVQFSPQDLHQSIDRVMAKKPTTLYPTHYGPIQPNAKAIARLHEHIDAYVMLAERTQQEVSDDQLLENLTSRILDYMTAQAISCNPSLDKGTVKQHLKMDANLNSQGLVVWLKKVQCK